MKERDKFFYGLSLAGGLAILSSTMSKNPVLGLFALSLETDQAMLGLIAAASTIPGILVSLPAGSLSDRFGRRKVMYAAGTVFATAPFLYLIVSTPAELMAVRFYHGFATAIFGTVANAAIVDTFRDQKAAKVSFFSSVTIVGRGLAPFLGGAVLLLTNSNYRDVYWIVGIAGVSALLAIAFIYRGGRDGEKRDAVAGTPLRDQLRSIVRDRLVLVASSVEAMQYLAYGGFEFFIVIYADSVGIDLGWIVLITGAQLLTVIFAKPILGRMSDNKGRDRLISGGCAVGGLALLVMPLTQDPIVLIFLSVVFGLGFAAVTSSTAALVSDLCTGSGSGSAMGFLSTVMDVGQASGPIIVGGVAATALGYLGGFGAMGVGLLLASAIFALAFMRPGAETRTSSARR